MVANHLVHLLATRTMAYQVHQQTLRSRENPVQREVAVNGAIVEAQPKHQTLRDLQHLVDCQEPGR